MDSADLNKLVKVARLFSMFFKLDGGYFAWGCFSKNVFMRHGSTCRARSAGADETSPSILLRRRSLVARRAPMFRGAQGYMAAVVTSIAGSDCDKKVSPDGIRGGTHESLRMA
jgi:hypothetical protein